MRAKEKDR